jgi:hypothetical protein
MSNFTVETLYPKVEIYKGLLPDHKEIFEVIKSTEGKNGEHYFNKWTPWASFGTYASTKFKGAVQHLLGQDETFDKEYWAAETVYDAYNIAIDDYLIRNNVQLPEGAALASSSFCKYGSDIDVLENNLTMQYHTDFKQGEKDMPGNQFFLTCTVYINDDYDGGDIEFYVDGKFISHKPKAGEIMVFPSGQPYYHGVKTATNGNKYLIRNFIMYPNPGSKEWLANQVEYGVFRWAEMEKERLAKDLYGGNLVFKDGKIVTFTEEEIEEHRKKWDAAENKNGAM